VLLYDLTSTYCESSPPFPEDDKRRYGYSRDHRRDCVQVVMALIVTPGGLPLAYKVLPGNLSDKTTLRDFLARIEQQYGKARRVWVMDRGLPTEETLEQMRSSDPPLQYLVGTPKGRLSRLEKDSESPGKTPGPVCRSSSCHKTARCTSSRKARDTHCPRARHAPTPVETTRGEAPAALHHDAHARGAPDEARCCPSTGAQCLAPGRYSGRREQRVFHLPTRPRQAPASAAARRALFSLRTNLTEPDPAALWRYYLQLVQVEEAFKNLQGDLAIRPIFHQDQARIEAHIFIAFLAYCLPVTLSRRLRELAPGLTARSVLDKFAAVPMIDVHVPTTDGREIVLTRYPQPEPALRLLLDKLRLALPAQPPPKITTAQAQAATPV
jgi:DDE family transposase